MPLDGITTYFLARELKERLVGARIDKIYQPDRYDIFLHVRQDSRNLKLLLTANPSGPRIHLTESSRENPALPPSFCMLLRKHLAGSRISDISSPSYERIIEISIQTVDELGDRKDKKLIIEMMGRYSNIILVNSENRIFDSLLHVDSQMSRVREVMPARPYEYPPLQGKIVPADALVMLSQGELPVLPEASNRPLEKALQESLMGFSPLLSREICYLSGVDARKGIRQLLPDEKERVVSAAASLLERIAAGETRPASYSIEKDAPPKEFHALLLKDAGYARHYDSISEAMDAVFCQKDLSVDFEQKKRSLLSYCQTSLQHAVHKQAIHQSDIHDCRDMGLYQKYGQLLLANSYRIPAGSASFSAIDYESEDGASIEIPMDTTRTVSQNAQAYFKRYSKCKSKLESASAFLEEDNRAVDYLSSLVQAIESASENDDIAALREEMQISGLTDRDFRRKDMDRKAYENGTLINPGKSKSGNSGSRALRAAGKAAAMRSGKGAAKAKKDAEIASSETNFRKFTSSDGSVILCGRNNIQNDMLTMKTASPDDLWFHVQKMPGTHVVLRSGKTTPSEEAILEAAATAAFYSRTGVRNEKNRASDPRQASSRGTDLSELKIAVDYCPVKNVRKPAKAKPGMVIYDHYNTLLVSPRDPSKSL